MFAQTLMGKVDDADRFMERIARWQSDVMPDAAGFVGATAGVSETGMAFVAAWFETEAAARSNQKRPLSEEWWDDTRVCFTDSPTSGETSVVEELWGGVRDGPQAITMSHGEVTDTDRYRELRDHLYDFGEQDMGVVFLDLPDNQVTTLCYFRSEEDPMAIRPELVAWFVDVISTMDISRHCLVKSPVVFSP